MAAPKMNHQGRGEHSACGQKASNLTPPSGYARWRPSSGRSGVVAAHHVMAAVEGA